MFTPNGEIPRFVGFFLMKRKPTCHDLKLLVRKRTVKQFSVDRYSRFIFTIIDVDMGFVVLSDIPEQHTNDHSPETA